MFKHIFRIINEFLNNGDQRTSKLKRNISASFIIKGFSILLGLIKVPIFLDYLNAEKYGIWLTIASIVLWIQHFDLGLGEGLKNKFAIALANGDKLKGKKLVSTAYISMSFIMASVFIIALPFVFILNWNHILNVKTIDNLTLIISVIIVLVTFILRFILQLILVILKADQRPAIADTYLPISNIISLVLIFIVRYYIKDSLIIACIILSVPQIIVLITGNLYFFKKDYRIFRPSIIDFDKSMIKDIFSLGLKFFIVQMIGLVLFNSQNLILTHVINPKEVTVFNIANQLFNLPMIFFMIILDPFWSAITEAYEKDEYNWIKNSMKKLGYISIIFSLGIILLLFCSEFIYNIWLGDKITIPFTLSIVFAIYNISIVFISPFNHFLNATGKLNLGLIVGIGKLVLFLPVAILLVQNYHSSGLVIALILINSLPNILYKKLQYKKIISGSASGIWNK